MIEPLFYSNIKQISMVLLANSVLVGVLTPTTYDVDVDDDVVYDTSSCPLNM